MTFIEVFFNTNPKVSVSTMYQASGSRHHIFSILNSVDCEECSIKITLPTRPNLPKVVIDVARQDLASTLKETVDAVFANPVEDREPWLQLATTGQEILYLVKFGSSYIHLNPEGQGIHSLSRFEMLLRPAIAGLFRGFAALNGTRRTSLLSSTHVPPNWISSPFTSSHKLSASF